MELKHIDIAKLSVSSVNMRGVDLTAVVAPQAGVLTVEPEREPLRHAA